MIKRLLMFVVIAMAVVSYGFAQEEASDRFVRFVDEENIFTQEERGLRTEFYLCNITVDESSKPVHVGVNDVTNVVKFGIRARSFDFENQRHCYLIISPENSEETLLKSLQMTGAKNVNFKGEVISVEEFYNRLKNN